MLAVLAPATWYVVTNYGKAQQSDDFGLWIKVEQLPETPQTYFHLSEADSYTTQAILKPGTIVHVGDWNLTQIDDMIGQAGVANFEYNNTYYSISCMSADPGPLITNDEIALVIVGWLVFGVALVITILALMGRLPLRQIFS